MCGVGFSYSPNSFIHKYIAEQINTFQYHRGPDYNKIVNYENFSILHQRLSIIDINERSNQPFKFKNIELSYNGEIYNFNELKRNLIKKGYKFLTTSDTEVLAIGLAEYGLDFVEKIDGMYAFCYIDHLKKKLYCSTDPFGIKQLYFFRSDKYFFITSELESCKKVVHLLGEKLTTNNKLIPHLLSYLCLPPFLTPFNEISKVTQGGLLEIDLESSIKIKEKKQFFKKRFPEQNSEINSLQVIENVLDDSMISDVGQAILISGGIDSTNIALSSMNKNLFFKGYFLDTQMANDGFMNDLPFANECAKKSSLPLKVIKNSKSLSSKDIVDALSKINNVGDLSACISLNKTLKYIKNDSLKVCHSGIGADEIFGGYRLMKNYKKINFMDYFLKYASFMNFNSLFLRSKNILPNRLSKQLDLINQYALEKNNNLNLISSLVTWDSEVKKKVDYKERYFISSYKSLIDFYFEVFLSSSHLPIMDSLSMSYSIELRVPFLSKRLFSSVYPDIYRKSIRKRILKKRILKIYGSKFVNRSKTGFGVSAINLSNSAIEILIDSLYEKYIDSYYSISKDILVNKLKKGNFVRFPYTLLSLLTYEKSIN